jgi:multiple sugar transport system permease protein
LLKRSAGRSDVVAVAPSGATSAALRRASRRRTLRRNAIAFGFLLPNLIVFSVFLVYPIYSVMRQSLFQGGVLGPAEYVGLENWRGAFKDPELRESVVNTAEYALLAVPVMVALGTILCLALREIHSRRITAAFVRVGLFLPTLAPVSVAALICVFLVQPDFGLFNLGNRALGLEPVGFLGSPELALPTLAALEVWRNVGFWALFLLAALLGVPSDLYGAAALDGASPLRRFWHVTLPSLRASLVVVVLLAMLFAMQAFDSVFLLTQGGPAGSTETAVLYLYRRLFQDANPGYGAVLSLILLVVIALMTVVLLRVLRSGSPKRARQV